MFSCLLPAHAGTAAGSFGVVLNLTSTFPPPTQAEPPPVVVAPPVLPPTLPPVVVVPPVTPQPPTAPVLPPVVVVPAPNVAPPLAPTANPQPPLLGFARGTCLNQALSSQTQASVRVVCGSSQFVSIEPAPGQPFVGTHGGAYRFAFGPGAPLSPLLSGGNTLLGGSGTVTGLRLIDISGLESFLEMLVSF